MAFLLSPSRHPLFCNAAAQAAQPPPHPPRPLHVPQSAGADGPCSARGRAAHGLSLVRHRVDNRPRRRAAGTHETSRSRCRTLHSARRRRVVLHQSRAAREPVPSIRSETSRLSRGSRRCRTSSSCIRHAREVGEGLITLARENPRLISLHGVARSRISPRSFSGT